MATAYENLIKHLNLAIRQLDQLKTRECVVDEEEMYGLVDIIYRQVLDLVDD